MARTITHRMEFRGFGCRRRGSVIGVFVAVLLAATAVSAVPAAAATDPPSQTDWLVRDPELTGPPEFWYPCVPNTGWGSNNCVFTGASGGEHAPTNCATWDLDGARVGRQELQVYVPHQKATATVTYRIEWTNAYTGTRYQHLKRLEQHSARGWTALAMLDLNASSVRIRTCDNEALQHVKQDPGRGLIGVDAVAARCVARCRAPASSAPHNAKASPHDEHRTKISWSHGSKRLFPRVGYRVQYSRPALVDHPIHVDHKPWSSIVYEALSPLHYSPPLRSGVTYRVDVWAVDVFGRRSPVASASFVHIGPNCRLGPHDSSEVKDPDSLTQAIGHLIGRVFGGPSQPYNLVPQVFVDYRLKCGTGNHTLRPDSFEIRWWLNGHEQIQ